MPDPKTSPNTNVTADAPLSAPPLTGSGPETLGEGRGAAGLAPVRFGAFTVVGELGRGGMGAVYRAEDPNLKREVALKVMLPQFAANPQAKARFLREARSQAAVEHDNVAPIFQVGEHDGLPYLVMPLLKGMTLHAAMKANPRPPLGEVIRIGREIAEGLAAAHEKGLVHRDIKPANVWLEGKQLRVKVLDFGLARAADAADLENDSGPVTREGAVLGTPAYMSPEQGRGGAVDARTDLWSLGVVLYLMTTGELPFHGPTTLAILTSLAVDHPPPPIERNPSVPYPLSALVIRLLSKDTAGRPPSAEVVAAELQSIQTGLAGVARMIPLGDAPPLVVGPLSGPDPFADLDATEASTSPVATPTTPRSPQWLWPVVALFLLAGLGAAVWAAGLFSPRKAATPPADHTPAQPAPKVPETPAQTPKGSPPRPGSHPSFFNGKDLTGWTGPSVKTKWRVIDGAIISESPGHKLSTERAFGDFELSFCARLPDPLIGRLVFRFRQDDTKVESILYFLEDGITFGGLKGRVPLRRGAFNDVTIRCVGTRVTVTANGVLLFDDDFEIRLEGGFSIQGLFGLQDVTLKDIRFTDLSPPKSVGEPKQP